MTPTKPSQQPERAPAQNLEITCKVSRAQIVPKALLKDGFPFPFRKSHSLPSNGGSNANDDLNLKEESGNSSNGSQAEGGLETRCGTGGVWDRAAGACWCGDDAGGTNCTGSNSRALGAGGNTCNSDGGVDDSWHTGGDCDGGERDRAGGNTCGGGHADGRRNVGGGWGS